MLEANFVSIVIVSPSFKSDFSTIRILLHTPKEYHAISKLLHISFTREPLENKHHGKSKPTS